MRERTIFLFFPTMKCQLQCPYCHFGWERNEQGYTWTGYGTEHKIEKELTAQEALKILEQFHPYHVEFSGGEPTLWPGFEEFVSGIPDGCQWAITSNTLLQKVRHVDLSRCLNWTASYHETKMADFIDNCVAIREKGCKIAISQVVTKDRVDECLENARLFSACGFMPNLLRELNPGVSWEGTPEWEKLVQAREQEVMNVVEDDIPPSYTFDKGFLCKGGHSYFSLMPDGKLYRCYSEAMHGNAIEKRDEMPQECWAECLGCALDHRARIKKLEKK